MSKSFKKGPRLPITARFRAARIAAGQVVKEIKGAKNADELMNRYTLEGYCRLCKNKTTVMTSTGTCINCSLFKDNKLKKKFKKHAFDGQSGGCNYVGFIDTLTKLCYNCWVKEGLWKQK